MKVFWTGTDSLMLTSAIKRRSLRKRVVWYIFRSLVRLLDKFYAEAHYVDADNLATRLQQFGVSKPITVLPDPIKHTKKYAKQKHEGFNVLYYMPQKTSDVPFWKWVYGYDIYTRLKKELPQVNWIEVDGSADMSEVYPIIDFYLRPNRSDGASRMRQECEIQHIPFYWSNENPNFFEAKKEILYAYRVKKKAGV